MYIDELSSEELKNYRKQEKVELWAIRDINDDVPKWKQKMTKSRPSEVKKI